MLSWGIVQSFLSCSLLRGIAAFSVAWDRASDRSSASKSDSADASNPPPLDYENFLEKLRTQLESSPYLQAGDIEIDGVKLNWNFARKPCSIPLMQGDAKAETKGRVVEPKEPERFTGRLADAPAPPCK